MTCIEDGQQPQTEKQDD